MSKVLCRLTSGFSGNSGGLGGVIHADGGIVSISNSTLFFQLSLEWWSGLRQRWFDDQFHQQYVSKQSLRVVLEVYYLLYGVDFSEVGSTYDSECSRLEWWCTYANHNVGTFLPNTISISDALFESNQAAVGSFLRVVVERSISTIVRR